MDSKRNKQLLQKILVWNNREIEQADSRKHVFQSYYQWNFKTYLWKQAKKTDQFRTKNQRDNKTKKTIHDREQIMISIKLAIQKSRNARKWWMENDGQTENRFRKYWKRYIGKKIRASGWTRQKPKYPLIRMSHRVPSLHAWSSVSSRQSLQRGRRPIQRPERKSRMPHAACKASEGRTTAQSRALPKECTKTD